MSKKKKSKKGEEHWRPRKADREALSQGELTPAAKKMNRVVDQAFRANDTFKRAQERYGERMESIYEKVGSDDRGLTVMSADGKRRVIFSKKNVVVGNQNAHMARTLINEYTSEMLQRKNLSSDEMQMAEFLTGVITESKGRIMMTKNLVRFGRMKFEDKRLRDAQRLLKDGFDVSESKLYYYCEELGSDGSWVRA